MQMTEANRFQVPLAERVASLTDLQGRLHRGVGVGIVAVVLVGAAGYQLAEARNGAVWSKGGTRLTTVPFQG